MTCGVVRWLIVAMYMIRTEETNGIRYQQAQNSRICQTIGAALFAERVRKLSVALPIISPDDLDVLQRMGVLLIACTENG